MFAHSTFNAAGGLISGLSVFVATRRLNAELTTGSSCCGNQRAALKSFSRNAENCSKSVEDCVFLQLNIANIPPQTPTVVFQQKQPYSQYYSFQSQPFFSSEKKEP